MLDLFDSYHRSPPFRPPFSHITSTLDYLQINNSYANGKVADKQAVEHNDISHIFAEQKRLSKKYLNVKCYMKSTHLYYKIYIKKQITNFMSK